MGFKALGIAKSQIDGTLLHAGGAHVDGRLSSSEKAVPCPEAVLVKLGPVKVTWILNQAPILRTKTGFVVVIKVGRINNG